MCLTLSAKVFLFGACIVLITVAALVSLAVWHSGRYNDLAQREVDDLINVDLDHIVLGVYNLIQTENEAVQQQVDADLNVAQHLLVGEGGVSQAAESVSWMAVNQLSGERTAIRLPKMLVGGQWLGNNPDPAVDTPVVDEVTRLGGESATVFQRMNPHGDMLRVATTVKTTKGLRAVGTYIPAINPDGTANPVVASVMSGKTYSGRAYVVNAYYLTAYQAIRDCRGAMVGMLYVGVKLADVEARVRQAILRTPVGRTGYVYVLGGAGKERGRYIISQRGERDGENIWGSMDSDGHPVIQEIVRKAVALRPGELATEHYRWQNPGESAPRWKVVRLVYFEPWDWVIGASVYEDELQGYRAILNEGRQRMTVFMSATGFAITVLIGLLGALLAWIIIVKPVRRMTAAVETIIAGNLNGTVDVRSSDEVGVLARTVNIMTERLKQTMESLRRSEEKYRGIFENAIEGFFQSSLEGRFLTVNPAMSSILGYDSPADLAERVTDIGRQLYVRPEDREEVIAALLNGWAVVRREVQFQRKDGGAIWVSLNDHLVRDGNGKPSHVDGFIYDISDRKKAEEALRQSEERFQQAQKMEAVGRLAGGIAHDFNNLLTVISGYADLLAEKVGNGVRNDVEEIQRAARRAAALTSQLLAFSRKQILERRVIKLGSLTFAMREMLQRLIGEDINLTIRSSEDEWLVLADPGRIEQIVMNLAVNARDAMPEGGQLTIETSNRILDNEYAFEHPGVRAGEYVQIAVSDTGHGMGKEVLSRLFEPFFTTKEQGKGTGLGLSTVYGIVKQSAGHITCHSEPGKGATFTIDFPRTIETRDETTAPVTGTAACRGSETILLVEDEESVRRYTKTVLENNGYTVIAASGGREAMAAIQLQKCKIALLVTDVVMPQMSGKELAEELLGACPTVKVLFLSGYAENAVVQQRELDPDINFLQKPFSSVELLKKTSEILDESDRRGSGGPSSGPGGGSGEESI
jgi:PAS domain S-box-containing protein